MIVVRATSLDVGYSESDDCSSLQWTHDRDTHQVLWFKHDRQISSSVLMLPPTIFVWPGAYALLKIVPRAASAAGGLTPRLACQ